MLQLHASPCTDLMSLLRGLSLGTNKFKALPSVKPLLGTSPDRVIERQQVGHQTEKLMQPEIGTLHTSIIPVGSRVTCDPPPTDTDQDWLVLVKPDAYDAFCDQLQQSGWEVGGSRIPYDHDTREAEQHFNSFTKGDDNLIVTGSEVFHRRFLAASGVAKKLNLTEKWARIMVFQAVLYSAIPHPQFEPMAFIPLTEEELTF